MTTVLGRVFPRFTTQKTDPPTDFVTGELVANLPSNSLFFKKPDGTVLVIPGVEAVQALIGNGGGTPGPSTPTGPRILYAKNDAVLYDQRQLFIAGNYTLPAGSMGLNSRLDIRAQVNSQQGNNTRIRIKFGGAILSDVPIYWGKAYNISRSIRNRNVLNQQVSNSWGGNYGEVNDAFGEVDTTAIDTSQDVIITLEIDNSGGNDRRCRLDSFEVILWP